MAILVSFMKPGGLGSISAVGIGQCRVFETLTLSTGATTSASAQEGEIAVVVNTETATVKGSRGSAPDAATTSATPVSDAAFAIPPSVPFPVSLQVGQKLNFKPLS